MTVPSSPPSSVLIAEDEPLVRMIAVEVLTDAGFEVIEANDGIDALQVLETREINLLITDIQMPRMNGFQLVEIAMARWPNLKVILVTGYARDNIPAQVARAAFQTIQKPFDIDRLPALVASMLGRG
jgi:DNA-binding NtrC family response regulator